MTRTGLAALVRDDVFTFDKLVFPPIANAKARLDNNENPAWLDAERARQLGEHLATVALNRYPDSEATALRTLIAGELGVSPQHLVFTTGSQELIVLLANTFAQPREGAKRARIMYPVPGFIGYRLAAVTAGVDAVEVPLRPDFELDQPALDRAFAERRPNVVYFGVPSNPSGVLWPREQLVRMFEAHRDVVFVSDEAYTAYCGVSLVDLLPQHPNLVVIRTLSKLCMAGVRIGYLVGAPELTQHVERIRPSFTLSALNQATAHWMLTTQRAWVDARVADIVAARKQLERDLAALPGVTVVPSHTNFIVFRIGTPDDGRAVAVTEQLAERGILVKAVARSGPHSDGIRTSVGAPDENAALLAELRELL